jgi:hypothetical protein
MGAGPNWAAVKAKKYRGLKKVQSELLSKGVDAKYKNLEVVGKGFVVYYAGIGPASNGEYFVYKVLRFNPDSQPSPNGKKPGDVDYTDFHTRDIPEQSLGGFVAGLKKVLEFCA